ncbi:homoserine O-acetyltransferase [Aquiluna sp. KACHI24]|uniref:homoserine O-acetyltransferase MetX n=1 Tax=Aquiluna sp. KACHI24 TaxID=2968831 RepID=UPI0021FD02F4|nr:homoserine O-acetyltransferase [Aquiluna sp. KACHI24]BDQ00571.1 homoserine O-acetyltransferase [Aquiluna sp. KACHI24]
MDFQISEDSAPSEFISEEQRRQLVGRPPATGAWLAGDPVGQRKFSEVFDLETESGENLVGARLAYESWGELNEDASNAILVLHALTGDSHAIGNAGDGHATAGWWNGIIGPRLAIDTDKYFVITPNVLGGCQGSTGPSSLDRNGREYGPSFPQLTIRDQAKAFEILGRSLGIETWYAIVGGSMAGMHALEMAIENPKLMQRLALLAAPPFSTADQIALNTVQLEAIRSDSNFAAGWYYDAKPGFGPHRGLALARRMALLNYRSPEELNERFGRSWQSQVSPLTQRGKYAVESYLDFHGNKFVRRFDANSYITLVSAMNSHDIARGRESVEAALANISCPTLVLGIDSDRLFPISGQEQIAAGIKGELVGGGLQVIQSEFGHDGFLIEIEAVGKQLEALLQA